MRLHGLHCLVESHHLVERLSGCAAMMRLINHTRLDDQQITLITVAQHFEGLERHILQGWHAGIALVTLVVVHKMPIGKNAQHIV